MEGVCRKEEFMGTTLAEIPDGLGAMQYAMKICEDLGIPNRGNVQMIGESIEAVAKSKLFRGREDALKVAYFWLSRRVMTAREQGAKVNALWFHGGEYWNVEKPDKPPANTTNCDAICRAHHGRGYDWNDVMWVWKRYEQEVKAGGKRSPEYFFKELDSKREGGPPSWRNNGY